MNHQQTVNEIERVFRDLEKLIKEGQFTENDIKFMEGFLEIALRGTRKAKKRIKEGKGNGSENKNQ